MKKHEFSHHDYWNDLESDSDLIDKCITSGDMIDCCLMKTFLWLSHLDIQFKTQTLTGFSEIFLVVLNNNHAISFHNFYRTLSNFLCLQTKMEFRNMWESSQFEFEKSYVKNIMIQTNQLQAHSLLLAALRVQQVDQLASIFTAVSVHIHILNIYHIQIYFYLY